MMFVNTFDALPFADGFTEEEIEILRPLFHWLYLPVGEVLFDQGALADRFYIVAQGEVLIRYKPEDGPALILTRVRSNGVVGWSAAIGSPTYTSSAVCAEECHLLTMRSEDLHTIYESNPCVARRLLDHLANAITNRLSNTHPQIMALLSHGMRIPCDSEIL